MNDTNKTETDDHGKSQALAQLESVREMVAALECDYVRLDELRDERQTFAEDAAPLGEKVEAYFDDWAAAFPEDAEELAALIEAAGDCEDEDEARQRIEEDALSVEVRSAWRAVGDTDDEPDEFRIVLCTGGPHVEIRGELQNGSPSRVWLEYQDWGTPMQDLPESWGDGALLAYASVFYFGE